MYPVDENPPRSSWQSPIATNAVSFTRFIKRRLAVTAQVLVALSFLSAGSADAAITVITKSNTTTGFADNITLSRSISFSETDFGPNTTISDVNISVSFAKSNNNSFVGENSAINFGRPYYNEINFVLTSPDNTSVTLISNAGANSFNSGSLNGFQGTLTFDQSATTAVNADRNNITSGTYLPADVPNDSLDAFNGGDAVGNWTLQISDDARFDGLSFYGYSVTITSVPEPQNLALWGALGIAAVTIVFHRPQRSNDCGVMVC